MRSRFDEQLTLLNKEMIEMGALCEEIINTVLKALAEKDEQLLSRISSLGPEIDQKERTIEALCSSSRWQQI